MTILNPVPSAVDLIIAERNRQMLEKGYTPEHDDKYKDNFLLLAASLLLDEISSDEPPTAEHMALMSLTEHIATKHVGDPIRIMTIVGALLAAEIDRRLRLQASQTTKAATS
jgi:hypothetical protein